jgi:hypothetical protein
LTHLRAETSMMVYNSEQLCSWLLIHEVSTRHALVNLSVLSSIRDNPSPNS